MSKTGNHRTSHAKIAHEKDFPDMEQLLMPNNPEEHRLKSFTCFRPGKDARVIKVSTTIP